MAQDPTIGGMCRPIEGGRGEVVGRGDGSDGITSSQEAQEEAASGTTDDDDHEAQQEGSNQREEDEAGGQIGRGTNLTVTDAALPETREIEELLLLSALHVRRADVQREGYNAAIASAVAS
eukprot:scaffold74545_cov56-Cyclotella_meneghiniana.AAC.1